MVGGQRHVWTISCERALVQLHVVRHSLMAGVGRSRIRWILVTALQEQWFFLPSRIDGQLKEVKN